MRRDRWLHTPAHHSHGQHSPQACSTDFVSFVVDFLPSPAFWHTPSLLCKPYLSATCQCPAGSDDTVNQHTLCCNTAQYPVPRAHTHTRTHLLSVITRLRIVRAPPLCHHESPDQRSRAAVGHCLARPSQTCLLCLLCLLAARCCAQPTAYPLCSSSTPISACSTMP